MDYRTGKEYLLGQGGITPNMVQVSLQVNACRLNQVRRTPPRCVEMLS